tara:strand:- start:1178 stop:2320 length:1143 start_codon:yes stop_codon:yes gene_type:complete
MNDLNKQRKINCLILGKSGVGKSSLLNYFAGQKIAETGIGRPVTPKKNSNGVGIFQYPPIDMGDYNLCVFDSWGIEADKTDDWSNIIHKNIEKIDVNLNVNSWYHCFLYCISAKGARIESFEVNSIIRPLIEKGVGVVFVLTKCDMASNDEIQGIKKEIYDKFGKDSLISEICSESKKLRGGKEIKPYGLNSLFMSMYESTRRSLIKKYQYSLFSNLDISLDSWIWKVRADFKSRDGIKGKSSFKKSSEFAKKALEKEVEEFYLRYERSFSDLNIFYKEMFDLIAQKSTGSHFHESKYYQYIGNNDFKPSRDFSFLWNIIFPINIMLDYLNAEKYELILFKECEDLSNKVKSELKYILLLEIEEIDKRLKKQILDINLLL